MAFSAVGLSADSGSSWTLPRLVGMAKAKELLLLSTSTVTADEALELGLATEVVPADEVAGRARAARRTAGCRADGRLRRDPAVAGVLRRARHRRVAGLRAADDGAHRVDRGPPRRRGVVPGQGSGRPSRDADVRAEANMRDHRAALRRHGPATTARRWPPATPTGATFTDPVFVGLRDGEPQDMWRMLVGRSRDMTVELVEHDVEGDTRHRALGGALHLRPDRPAGRQRRPLDVPLRRRRADRRAAGRLRLLAVGAAGAGPGRACSLGWTPVLQHSVSATRRRGRPRRLPRPLTLRRRR